MLTTLDCWDRILLSAPQATPVVIRRIPFARLRDICHARGLREGQQIEVVELERRHVLLRTDEGMHTFLENRYASVIEIEVT